MSAHDFLYFLDPGLWIIALILLLIFYIIDLFK
jgi:hypothetical protein